jgi:hypothetical protein
MTLEEFRQLEVGNMVRIEGGPYSPEPLCR